MRSTQEHCAKSASFGGNGGQPFVFRTEGQSLRRLEVRAADENAERLQGLCVELTNGEVGTFGTVLESGQASWTVEFPLSLSVLSIAVHKSQARCCGILFATTEGTQTVAAVSGKQSLQMEFRAAKLLGVYGRAGTEINKLGFFYSDHPDGIFGLPPPLPEKRLELRTGNVALTESLTSPFGRVERVDVTAEAGLIVGLGVRFTNGVEKTAGKFRTPPDSVLHFSVDDVISEVAIKTSELGYVSSLGLRTEEDEKFDPSEDQGGLFREVQAQLMGLHCGWSENGYMNAVSLLMSPQFGTAALATLPTGPASLQPFRELRWDRVLHSVFGYVQEEALVGLGLSFTDGTDVIRGVKEATQYASQPFPQGYGHCTVKTRNGKDDAGNAVTQGLSFSFPGSSVEGTAFGAAVGDEPDDQSVLREPVIGARGRVSDGGYKIDVVSVALDRVTPLAGMGTEPLSSGSFFETGSLYSRREATGGIVCIHAWWNKESKTLNGLQIQQSSGERGAVFATEVGMLTGKHEKVTMPPALRVTELAASIAPMKGGRLSGLRVTGLNPRGKEKSWTVGKLLGQVHRHAFPEGRRWVGLYAFLSEKVPKAVGFVVDRV